MAATSTEPVTSCKTCHTLESSLSESLKHCANCKTTLYCSRDCQRADWKSHKLVCSSGQPKQKSKGKASSAPNNGRAAGASPFSGLNITAVNPMDLLKGLDNELLHTLPEKDALGMLIDCFRLRVEDESVWGANNIGLYSGEDPRPAFREFLDLAESRPGILPPWWNAAKRKQCERMAVNPNGWNDINCAVEKGDIIEHYGDSIMPMKLRVLGEKIYGKGLM